MSSLLFFCLLSSNVLFVFTVFHFYLLVCCLNYFIEQCFPRCILWTASPIRNSKSLGGNALVVQWLGLYALTAEARFSPGQWTTIPWVQWSRILGKNCILNYLPRNVQYILEYKGFVNLCYKAIYIKQSKAVNSQIN